MIKPSKLLPLAGIMKELAEEYSFQYNVITADIDEQALGDRTADPAELVKLLAQAKADAICHRLKSEQGAGLHGLLLTCDQVVVHQDQIREKPVSKDQVLATGCMQDHVSHADEALTCCAWSQWSRRRVVPGALQCHCHIGCGVHTQLF